MTEVIRLDSPALSDRDELSAFLRASADACLYHGVEWQDVLAATYGHRTLWFVAREAGRIVGVFPLVAVRHPLLGVKLVALPYQYHSGVPVAADDTIRVALVERAIAHGRETGARHLEIRHHAPVRYLDSLGFAAIDSGLVTTATALEGLELASIGRGHREFVGHAARRGVELSESDTMEDLRAFRRLYLAEQRRFGSPQAGPRLFESIGRLFGPRCRLLLARRDGILLGGLLTIDDGRTVFARCSATALAEARRLHVGKALFWRALIDARRRGCRHFDFGVSARSDTGLVAFKEGWRGVTRPVHLYGYALQGSPPQPGTYFDGFRVAKAIWRRLPLPVVDWLGQRVTRWVC